MKILSFCRLALLPVLLVSSVLGQSVPYLLETDPTGRPNKILWQTEPGNRYDLWTSDDLADWNQVAGYPLEAGGLAMGQEIDLGPKGFFKIIPLDEQPPVVASQYPGIDGFAVGRFADLSIGLEDVSGIDPASVQLTVGNAGPLTAGAPGLLIDGNILTYDSGDAALGAWGETITTTLVVADSLGNTLTHTWSFRLELEPLLAENILVFGSNSAPSGLTIDSVDADRIIIAYGEGGAPDFSADQLLCNQAPRREEEIFYRRVQSVADNPATSRLTVFTENVPLTDFIVQGSAALTPASAAFDLDETGNLSRALSFDGGITFPRMGLDLGGTGFKLRQDGYQITVDGTSYSQGNASPFLECTMTEFSWWFTPRVRAAFEVEGKSLKSFEAVASGQVESTTAFVGSVTATASGGPWTLFDLPESKEPKRIVIMWVGFVPVWAVVSLDFEIEAEAEAKGVLSFHALSQQSTNASIGVSYEQGSGLEFIKSFQSGTPVTTRDADLTGEVSATLRLEPEVEFTLYGLAGFEAGIEPSATFSVKVEPELKICFDSSLDFVLEPAGPAFELAGITGEFRRNITSSSSCDEFAFTTHPVSQAVEEKSNVTFECVVDAPDGRQKDVKFQWFHNGTAIPGQTARSLFLHRVNAGHTGIYNLTAILDEKSIESEEAMLSILGQALDGFVLIPAGNFQMGDNFAEGDHFLPGGEDELPVHKVNLSDFYIGKYEVTKELWDSVRTWGAANGYTDLPTGDVKAANHPVHNIRWDAVVKWCNARSQRDGLTPCYTVVGGAVYKTHGTRLETVECNWNASGYRLPTEAEWEKAARGGLTGKRFPWGDTISHAQANYRAMKGLSYDLSWAVNWYHPTYHQSTSPVGSFAPNGYGLYDIAGNLSEWVWDSYQNVYYASSPNADPRGPSQTIYSRVIRGGHCQSRAFTCRVASRWGARRQNQNDVTGFRMARSSVP